MHSIRVATQRRISLVVKKMPAGASVLETVLEMERQYPFPVHDGHERRVYSEGVDDYVRSMLDAHTEAIKPVLDKLRGFRRQMKRTHKRQAFRIGHRLPRRCRDEGGEEAEGNAA